MTQVVERELIAEYWFRTLITDEYSISDIVQIINEFGDSYEQFDRDLSHSELNMDEGGLSIDVKDNLYDPRSAFGMITTNI